MWFLELVKSVGFFELIDQRSNRPTIILSSCPDVFCGCGYFSSTILPVLVNSPPFASILMKYAPAGLPVISISFE